MDNPARVDWLMKGLAEQLGQENDLFLVDGIRNNLFGPPGAGGVDLAALDIQRGRDHGLPDYNSLRDFYGLDRVTAFDEISSDPTIQAKLEELYGTVDNIDAFVGALAEDHLPGSSVGELVNAIIVNQFTRLRDGDRFFYAGDPLLSSRFVERIIDLDDVTLSKIIRWNTEITHLQENVFFDPSVLYYQVSDGGPSSVSVVATSNYVGLVNSRSGRWIDFRRLSETSQVILVGAEGSHDLFTVDVAGARSGLEDGVVVYGGGGFDVLGVRGTRRSDRIVVDAPQIEVNRNVVDFAGCELLVVLPEWGRDYVRIRNGGDARVVVWDPDHAHHREGRGESAEDPSPSAAVLAVAEDSASIDSRGLSEPGDLMIDAAVAIAEGDSEQGSPGLDRGWVEDEVLASIASAAIGRRKG